MSSLAYKVGTCNVPNCAEPEYKHHMCKKHYDFYSANQITARFMEEVDAIEKGTAGWKLKLKLIMQFLVHHALNWPMPLIHHFPLEHVFIGELYSLRTSKTVDRKRVEQVIGDFDISKNENIADMRRILNIRDIETSELGPKEKYLLGNRDLPSKLPILISAIGFILLFCFFEWIISQDILIKGYDLLQLKTLYYKFMPLGYSLILVVLMGVLMPTQYNFFIERCYNMTLYNDVKDNADVVNQVRFVKERKALSGGYYWTLFGVSTGLTIAVFWSLLSGDTIISWSAVFLCFAISMAVVPLMYSYNEMALFYPVVESMKKKRVAIDLYNADHRGGLSRYHSFLYKIFLYNEGITTVLIMLYRMLPISKWWIILLIPTLLMRYNHAGWAIAGWIRSIVDFYKEKRAEKARLSAFEGSVENMEKMELLNKVYPLGIIPFLKFLILSFLIPYIVNQLSELSDFVEFFRNIMQ